MCPNHILKLCWKNKPSSLHSNMCHDRWIKNLWKICTHHKIWHQVCGEKMWPKDGARWDHKIMCQKWAQKEVSKMCAKNVCSNMWNKNWHTIVPEMQGKIVKRLIHQPKLNARNIGQKYGLKYICEDKKRQKIRVRYKCKNMGPEICAKNKWEKEMPKISGKKICCNMRQKCVPKKWAW